MFVEQLEDRQMLAASPISLSHGTLNVRAAGAGAIIGVTLTAGKVSVSHQALGTIRVTLKKFAPRQISKINISGLNGDEHVLVDWASFKGNTTFDGGPGDDWITVKTAGSAQLVGGGGDDTLAATVKKSSTAYGDEGNDVCLGGDSKDTLVGGAGNDVVSGYGGNDLVRGGEGDDTVQGGVGNDSVYGETGNDELWGWDGDDLLDAGSGENTIYAGKGNDKLFAQNGQIDRMLGEEGSDSARIDLIDIKDTGDPDPDEIADWKESRNIETIEMA